MAESTVEHTEIEDLHINVEGEEAGRELRGFWAINKDRLFRYRTIIGLGFIALLAELAYATLNQSALQPYVDKELNLGAGWLGWIMATFLLVEALSRPGLGALGDRFGRRPLLIAGPAASCLAALLIANVRHPGAILALRVLDGLGAAAIWPAAFALVGDIVEERNRSTAMSVLNVTYMLGIALAFEFGGRIADAAGTQVPVFYAVAGLFLLTMIVAFFVAPGRNVTHRDSAHEESVQYHLSYLLYSLKVIPEMLGMVFFAFGAIGLLIPVSKLFAMDQMGLTQTELGNAVLWIAAALAAFAMPLGRLGDKWGKVESVRLGMTLTAFAMWALALSPSLLALIIAGSLLGMGFLIAMPAWMALVTSLSSSNNRGQILGAVGMAQGFGAIFGAIAGGHLYDGSVKLFGINPHLSPIFLSAALLTVSALMAFVFMKRREPKGQIE
jgi:MFS family permease